MAARGSPQMIEEEWERAGESHSSSGGAKESVAVRSVHLPRPPFSERPQAVLGRSSVRTEKAKSAEA